MTRSVASGAWGRRVLLGAVALSVSACGVEALLGEAFDEGHELPTTVIAGTVQVADAEFTVLQPDGAEVVPLDSHNAGTTFEIVLPSLPYQNLRVVATKGEKQVRALIPRLTAGSVNTGLEVGSVTTTMLTIIEAKMSAEGRSLATLSPETLAGLMRVMKVSFGQAGTAQDFQRWVANIIAAADVSGSTLPFQTPVLDADYKTITSGLSQAWLDAANLDYDEDGRTNTGTTATAAYDAALEELARGYDFAECLNPKLIRAVFEVDFNEGRKDGNCVAISRFRWASDEPGKSMFFVASFHETSPVLDLALAEAMGAPDNNQKPNRVPMFDDGTNGDSVAGDNIWTIYFDVPRGARLRYKYTWGRPNALWGGSEEFPGNSRLLEAVDVNGDDIVLRRDNFQDEATNKDEENLNRRGNGKVDFETDVNGDGIPDARERMIDVDNDCVLDEWMTPVGVGPAMIDCAEIGSQ